jgi:SAM-dependent methyltransferase
MEADFWHGPADHNAPVAQVHTRKWEEKLLGMVLKEGFFQDQTVLNVAGGNGNEAEFLLRHGAASVALLDIAPGQLASAKTRIAQHQLKSLDILLGDAENLPVRDARLDTGFIFFALHHIPCHREALHELCRASKRTVIIDIMDCGLTRFLNKFGLFLTEFGNLVVTRGREEEMRGIILSHHASMKIRYFFIPPYFGNNRFILLGMDLMERPVNFLIQKNRTLARFFGNVAVITGY